MPKRGFAYIEAEGRMQVREARDFVLIFACGPVFECTFSILTRDGSWGTQWVDTRALMEFRRLRVSVCAGLFALSATSWL
jgi:hypothetical protein